MLPLSNYCHEKLSYNSNKNFCSKRCWENLKIYSEKTNICRVSKIKYIFFISENTHTDKAVHATTFRIFKHRKPLHTWKNLLIKLKNMTSLFHAFPFQYYLISKSNLIVSTACITISLQFLAFPDSIVQWSVRETARNYWETSQYWTWERTRTEYEYNVVRSHFIQCGVWTYKLVMVFLKWLK